MVSQLIVLVSPCETKGGGKLGSEEGADWFANAGIALLAGIGAFVHHGK